MINYRLNRIIYIISILIVPLGLFSGEIGAATIDRILHSDGATTVDDSATDPTFTTVLSVEFNGTTEGLWLDMNENSSTTQESLKIKIRNNTNVAVNRLEVEVVKPNGEPIGSLAPLFFLGGALTIINPTINPSFSGVVTSTSSHRIGWDINDLPSGQGGNSDLALLLKVPGIWNGFEIGNHDWWLNINLNNDPTDLGFDTIFANDTQVVSTPIPGAIWLFGSGLLGLLVRPRRTRVSL